jgi:hypothetical protein
VQSNDVEDKLFDAVIKVAAEEALIQEMSVMPSCDEANSLYQPSVSLDKKINKIISHHKRMIKAASWKKSTLKIAAAYAIFITISISILFSVEATRNLIFNAVVKLQEDYFSIEHSESSNVKPGIYKPAYLPDCFKEASYTSTGNISTTIYLNEAGFEISLSQFSSQTSNILSDLEDKEFTNIEINQHDAYLVKSNDVGKDNTIIWEYSGYIFHLASQLESNELILIAESIGK